jgi:hypothetical protein
MEDEDFNVLVGDLLDFVVAVEQACAILRTQIAKMRGVAYDMEKIKWEPAEGKAGAYEKSSDANSPDFKALLKDIQAHGGKMTVGPYFVWAFKNGNTLGRKKRKR